MLKQKSLSEIKNTIVENGLLFESKIPGQNNPVSKTAKEKDALMAASEMKIISAIEIIFDYCQYFPKLPISVPERKLMI